MLRFVNPKSHRVFLVNMDGLSVFAIRDNQLTNIARFSDEDIGYSNFHNYLEDTAPTPVVIIVDSVAEDFVVEKVAHVGTLDRKAFLRRKSDQHFRGLDYRSATVIGRDAGGRKSDRVLFSAIAKNAILEPWIKTVLSCEIPVSCITSPAYALKDVAAGLGLLEERRVLLVTWETSGIRHTFIEKGKTLFSRLTPLPGNEEANLADAIVESCNQSNDYLERIGLIGFEESMEVHVITPQLPDDIFADLPSNRNFSRIVHHNSAEMIDPEQFHGEAESITAIMLCVDWALRRSEFENIYGSPAAIRFQQLYSARRLMRFVSLVILLVGVASATPMLLDALEQRLRVAEVQADIIPVQSLYDALTAEFPETPIPSEALELSVETYNRIMRQAASPTEFLQSLGTVMARYPGVSLDSIEWRLAEDLETRDTTAMLLDNSGSAVIDVFGTLVGGASIGDSDRQLRAFIQTLDELEGVSARAIAMPIEEGPEGAVNAVIGEAVADAEFAVRLSREI